MSAATDPAASLRQSVYLLLTAAAVAIATAKVVGAENVLEPSRYTPPTADGYSANPPDPPRNWPATRPDPSPMFSSNDKSRWATVKALVENGTYVIGYREYPDGGNPKVFTPTGIVAQPMYRSLDIVLRPLDAADTGKPVKKEFYSSKPPLFATALAGEYWVIRKLLGWEIDRDRWLVIPTILLTVNVIPFAVYLLLIARLIEATGATHFGRLLAFTTACFGTFLLTFSGTLNNHLPAAFCVLFASYPLLRAVVESRDMGPSGYLACGFFAALAACLDLPAAAFLAGLGVPLLVARPRNTVLFFLPGAIVPVIGLFACNYAALGQWLPAYSEFGGPWYNFEGSHWAKKGTLAAKGIDFATETKDVYAFHLLFGHHGWFSLTPVFLLSVYTLVTLGIRSAADLKRMRPSGKGSPWTLPLFASMTLAVSVVVIGFYVVRTNNYGGFTSGPRWLFWLIPLWVLAVPAAADRLAGSKFGRGLAAVLLGLAVLSVFYPAWNPWRPPWILQWMEYSGTLRY